VGVVDGMYCNSLHCTTSTWSMLRDVVHVHMYTHMYTYTHIYIYVYVYMLNQLTPLHYTDVMHAITYKKSSGWKVL